MCGIFGYASSKNDAVEIVINGLKKLEYRGYDSAGIAGLQNGVILSQKEVGKVAVLEEQVKDAGWQFDVAIAQTRWATHGKPSVENAHPHFDGRKTLALVHNGIIENHAYLKRELQKKGCQFVSETDTEVIAHLIACVYKGNLVEAINEAMKQMKGAYALAIIHKDYPGQIFAVAHASPLVVGLGDGEVFVSSDSNAFAERTKKVLYLTDGELAVVQPGNVSVYDTELKKIDKIEYLLDGNSDSISKGDFAHFTLKEIFEQPAAVQNALASRLHEEYGTAIFEELNFRADELLSIERILILACGTSWHAGCVASYMIEEKARIPVQVEISSEFRYKNPVIPHGTLVIAISQSGETADTIAAVRELKAKGARVLALCNVYGSTLPRESDSTIYLRAGPEIGVCSTKAFTNQVVILSLFALSMARMRHMGKQEGQEFVKAIRELPAKIDQVLSQASAVEKIAKKYRHYENFFFIGRNYMYPTSLEGALKLKEISYVNANGYPAGEMKHGPIALINENCPTVALCANKLTYEKLLSNLMEVKARNGLIIAIAEESAQGLEGVADDIIRIPDSPDELACVLSTIVTQLFAYYVARERGADIDQPRNLAKSVTVE